MTTVINTPGNNSGDDGSGMGFLVGVILVIVVGFLFFRYGLPAIRGTGETKTTNINVQLPDVKVPAPTGTTGGSTTGAQTNP